MRRAVTNLIAGLMLAAAGACSFTIDEDELGGFVCDDLAKECNVEGTLRCVGLDDPSYGCARRNCIPCNLPKSIATCSPATGECVVGSCIGDWQDCDGSDSNGCETNIAYDPLRCGGCEDAACKDKPNAEVACGGSTCYIRVCNRGFKDCNDSFEDGCEVDARSDNDNCGECGIPCATTCTEGVCEEA